MDDSKLRFGVGVLVIAAIGIGVILTFLFGAFPAILNSEYTLLVEFRSAEGINSNTPVLRDGVKVGRVSDIQLRDEGGVILTLAMDTDYPMSHRYVPQIGIGSLITGDSKLEFQKKEPRLLEMIHRGNLDLIDQPYTDGEYLDYGKKLDDPFTLLFGMENELKSTFRSIRGAGDAVQDIGQSIEGLVRDVRDVIGLEGQQNVGGGGGRRSGFPSGMRRGPGASTTAMHLPPAPAWAKPVVWSSESNAPSQPVVRQVVALQDPAFQSPAGVPPGGIRPRGIPPGAVAPPGNLRAAPTIRDLTLEAIETLEEFQRAVADVRSIVGNEQIRNNLTRSSEQLPVVLDEAAETLRTTQETFESFQKVGNQFEQVGVVAEQAVEGVDETVRSLQGSARNIEAFTEPLGQRGGELVEAALRSMANLDNALVQINTFGEAINKGDGTLRRLIEDDDLYFQLRRTMENVEAATARVRPILEDVRVFSDKIARDPRQLGVRGAIGGRPTGMGLK